MALSKRWTAELVYKHAAAQFGDMDPVAYADRFNIVNLAQFTVVSNFYGLMSAAYMTPVTLTLTDIVKFATAGNANFTLLGSVLAASSVTFVPVDVGKMVVMRKGTSGWLGTILSYVDPNTVTLYGPQLPTSDQAALDEFMALDTSVTGAVLDISTLPIMRAGGPQVKLELECTGTTFLDTVSAEKYRTFRASDPVNYTKVVWYVSGNYIYVAWGDGLTSGPGTFTLRFPRVPIDVGADTDYVDLPDGAPIQLLLVVVKRMLDNRFIKSKADYTAQLTEAVDSVMRTFGIVGKTEEIQNKVQTLAA